ncbi:MAG: redox-regulated ATPase YchF [Deltaproteobacteria bacterium]|jgi:GTP-binding protein YchF|nr:redox-regulated ATPase YchF [Deltaproteobacteria bacterium]
MSLSIGIVGLPNVGKSTLFNALTSAQNAEAANYPFCTIEPNKATVAVPDARLAVLAKLVNPQRVQHATVDFIDIAGLVRGASKGEGLGNQFLANIRECAAIVHVVRCFDDDNVTHVEGGTDPLRDVEIIETELLLADIQGVEKRLERIAKMAKGDKAAQSLKEDIAALLAHMNAGNPASSFAAPESELFRQNFREMGLITAKKTLYCANIDESALANGAENAHSAALRELAATRGAGFVSLCAKIEEEMIDLSGADLEAMLASYGIARSGLASVIRSGYAALGLISYFTAGEKEVKAWTIHRGDKAPQAAGVIHTDFERGFIRAEVIAYDDYVALGSEAAARSAGLLRTEGREYGVKDGDVVHFLFNV